MVIGMEVRKKGINAKDIEEESTEVGNRLDMGVKVQ